MLFKMLNRQAWKESGHNPDRMLRDLSPEILSVAAENPDYLRHYHVVMSLFQNYMTRKERPFFNGNKSRDRFKNPIDKTVRSDSVKEYVHRYSVNGIKTA